MNYFINNNSDIIDTVFGKYTINDNFINWYLNFENEINDLFMELLNISDLNGVNIDNNDENFNTFIIMMYNESNNI